MLSQFFLVFLSLSLATLASAQCNEYTLNTFSRGTAEPTESGLIRGYGDNDHLHTDDQSLELFEIIGGELHLVGAAGGYWFNEFDIFCIAHESTHLEMKVRTVSGTSLGITLGGRNPDTIGTSQLCENGEIDFATASTSVSITPDNTQQTLRIPLNAFVGQGVVTDELHSVALSVPAGMEIYVDDIRLMTLECSDELGATSAPTPAPTSRSTQPPAASTASPTTQSPSPSSETPITQSPTASSPPTPTDEVSGAYSLLMQSAVFAVAFLSMIG